MPSIVVAITFPESQEAYVHSERTHSIRIAVIDEQIKGIREQQRSHNATTQRRFDEMESKIDALIAIINRGRGAYAASLVLAGLIGGFVIKMSGVLIHFFNGKL